MSKVVQASSGSPTEGEGGVETLVSDLFLRLSQREHQVSAVIRRWRKRVKQDNVYQIIHRKGTQLIYLVDGKRSKTDICPKA